MVDIRYESEKYWSKRFSETRLSFKGPGHSGKTEVENIREYEESWKKILPHLLCMDKILDVGTGNGFYIKKISSMRTIARSIDITDVLFHDINALVIDSGASVILARHDITSTNPLPFTMLFDAIIMIDVEQHIMRDDLMEIALEKLWGALEEGGKLIWTCHCSEGRLELDHEVMRTFNWYKQAIPSTVNQGSFRDKFLLTATK